MGQLIQGSQYEEEGVPGEEEAAPKKPFLNTKIPLPILVAAFVAVVLLIIIVWAFVTGDGAQKEGGVTEPTDTLTEVGNDDYWSQFGPGFAYSAAEKAELRAWGYTGDEIEENAANEVPAASLIAAVKEAQEEALATLANPESPEYRALVELTWVGQDTLNLPSYQAGVTEKQLTYISRIINADYQKVPAHGHNLFLKVYLQDGSYVFMTCSIIRYMQLADKGNIVVRYTEINGDGFQLVEDMEEVNVLQ